WAGKKHRHADSDIRTPVGPSLPVLAAIEVTLRPDCIYSHCWSVYFSITKGGCMRMWFWTVAVILMALPAIGRASQPAAAAATVPDAAPLDLVIAQTKAALDQYQKSLGG